MSIVFGKKIQKNLKKLFLREKEEKALPISSFL